MAITYEEIGNNHKWDSLKQNNCLFYFLSFKEVVHQLDVGVLLSYNVTSVIGAVSIENSTANYCRKKSL